MDPMQPLTWLISEVTSVVSAGAQSAAAGLSNGIMPLVTACFGIYILLIAVNMMRGGSSEPVWDVLLRIASFAVVVGIGLSVEGYANTVIPIVTTLGNDLANLITNAQSNENALDQLALHYMKILEVGYTDASHSDLWDSLKSMPLFLVKAALVVAGLLPFLVAATVTIIVAKVGVILVAMLGPLFFAFLLFPATRQYFSAWVNTAFSYALIPLLVAVISTVSLGLSKKMLGDGAVLSETSLTDVFLASLGNLTLLFLLQQVSSMASALSAGGINASVPYGAMGALARMTGSVGKGLTQKGSMGVARLAKAGYNKATSVNSIKKAG